MKNVIVIAFCLSIYTTSFSQTIISGTYDKVGDTSKQKVAVALINTTIKYFEFLDKKDSTEVLEAKKYNLTAKNEFKNVKPEDFSNKREYEICQMSFKLFDDFSYKNFTRTEKGVSKQELVVSGNKFYITGENAGFISQLVVGQKMYKEFFSLK